jgi:hypothetical protein
MRIFRAKKDKHTLKQELAYYLTSRQDIVRYFIILEKQFQATSDVSESIFSIANYVGRKERASLSSRNLRFSMILREEPKFENKVLKK